jgi:hypothetical protein
MRIDLPSKARCLGVPVTHVHPDAVDACVLVLGGRRKPARALASAR